MWWPVFVEGIYALPWNDYITKLYLHVKKLPSLGYSPVTRLAGANIQIVTIKQALAMNYNSENFINDCCGLFKSADIETRIAVLDHAVELFPLIKHNEGIESLNNEVLENLQDSKEEIIAKAMTVIAEVPNCFPKEKLMTIFIPELLKRMSEPDKSINITMGILKILNKIIDILVDYDLITLEISEKFHKFFEYAWNSKGINNYTLAINALPSMANLEFCLTAKMFSYHDELIARINREEFYLLFSNVLSKVIYINYNSIVKSTIIMGKKIAQKIYCYI